MSNTVFNEYDLVVLVIMIISTLIAILRGFIREVFSLLGWIGAAIITFIFFEPTANYLGNYFESKIVVSGISVVGLFTISLIAISLVNMILSDFSRAIRLGAIDRSLGLAFGFVRGMIIVSVIHYCITLVYNKPEEEPKWFKDATTYNFTNFGAGMLKDLTHDYIHNAKNEDPSGKNLFGSLSSNFANFSSDKSAFSAMRDKELFRKILKGLPVKDKEIAAEDIAKLGEYPTGEQKNRVLLEMLITYNRAHKADLIKDENKLSDSELEKLDATIKKLQKSFIKHEIEGQPWLNEEPQNNENSGGGNSNNSVEERAEQMPEIILPENLPAELPDGMDQ